MALQTSYTGPDGVDHPAAYWRVISGTADYISNEVRGTVARYHDAAARRAGKAAEMFPFTLTLDPAEFDAGGARGLVYTALKGQPLFTGAIDV